VHSQPPGQPDPLPAIEDFQALVARVRCGELEAVPQLRAYLECHPEVWRNAGDVARIARDAWLELIAGDDLVAREVLARDADALEAELAGPTPSPLERLLVQRVVACRLQSSHADAVIAQAGAVSVRHAEVARRRQDSAHRRFLTAVGALTMVRRLLPTAVEVPAITGQVSMPSAALAEPSDEVGINPASDARSTPGDRNDAEYDETRHVVIFDPSGGGAPDGGKSPRTRISRLSPAS
jgi:hypothetical protein